MVVLAVICFNCKHWIDPDPDTPMEERVAKCQAFPDGIPDEILSTDIIHKEPYEGDGGIQFEPAEPVGSE